MAQEPLQLRPLDSQSTHKLNVFGLVVVDRLLPLLVLIQVLELLVLQLLLLKYISPDF
jgi:hypothetical protein